VSQNDPPQPSHTTVHSDREYGGSPNSTNALFTACTLLSVTWSYGLSKESVTYKRLPMTMSLRAVRCSALHGYPLVIGCQQHGRSLDHGLAPLLWPRLTSAPLVSLWHSRVPPSQRSKRRSPQVRTHPFGQFRLHLLNWDCCLRALARCAA
jgi:hypothetical protein